MRRTHHRPPLGRTEPSDAELIVAAGTDAHAFRLVYDRHAEAVLRYFERRVGHHHTALDLTAETFAQAWVSRARFSDKKSGSAGPWLFGIARNLLRHWQRRAQIEATGRQRLGIMLRVTTDPGQEDSGLADAEHDVRLHRALTDLPAGQVAAVKARVVEDQSYDDVAAALDISPTAARIRVSRGLGALRTSLEETEDER